MQNKLKFILIGGALLLFTFNIHAFEITATSLTGFYGINMPVMIEGELLNGKDSDTQYCTVIGFCTGGFVGKTVISDQNEAYMEATFGGSFALEFFGWLILSVGGEYEKTKVFFKMGDKYLFEVDSMLGGKIEIWPYPREIIHRTITVPLHLGFKIPIALAENYEMKIYLNGGPNFVYYLDGIEEYKFATSKSPDKDDVKVPLTPVGTLLDLPLDIAIGANLQVGFPVPFVGGEFLLGVGFNYFLNSPEYYVKPDIEIPGAHSRDYSLIFSPAKGFVGYKIYLSQKEKESTKAPSSSRGSKTTRAREFIKW